MTTAGLVVNDFFPAFWRKQRRLQADITILEEDGFIPCVTAWARRGAEMDWNHPPRPPLITQFTENNFYVPVLLEADLGKVEAACRRVSYRMFKAGLYALGSRSIFREMPLDVLAHLHKMGNSEPTAAAHFERAVYTVASDGVLFARYISVDLRRLHTPRLFNQGYYSDEYPTTEEEDEEEEEEEE